MIFKTPRITGGMFSIRLLPLKSYGRVCRVIVIPLVFSVILFPLSLGAEPLFNVKAFQFCRNVVDNVPLRPYENPTRIEKNESLWIWLEITVNEQGYRFLKNLGKLPIYVTWGKDGWLIGKAVDIGITPGQWESNEQGIFWKSKNSSDSTFTWRTHAVRETLKTGEYYVSVLDANRRPVTTLDDTVNSFKPKIQLTDVKK